MSQSEQSLQPSTNDKRTVQDAIIILDKLLTHLAQKNCSHCKRIFGGLSTS